MLFATFLVFSSVKDSDKKEAYQIEGNYLSIFGTLPIQSLPRYSFAYTVSHFLAVVNRLALEQFPCEQRAKRYSEQLETAM